MWWCDWCSIKLVNKLVKTMCCQQFVFLYSCTKIWCIHLLTTSVHGIFTPDLWISAIVNFCLSFWHVTCNIQRHAELKKMKKKYSFKWLLTSYNSNMKYYSLLFDMMFFNLVAQYDFHGVLLVLDFLCSLYGKM